MMKPSIALTLFITIALFGYVSGYSIGAHNKLIYSTQANTNVTAPAAGYSSAAAGGYGSQVPESTSKTENGASSPGSGQ